jgi:hypothetical protein
MHLDLAVLIFTAVERQKSLVRYTARDSSRFVEVKMAMSPAYSGALM